MRCKCCDSSKTKYIYDDWYCYECADVIRETMREDTMVYSGAWKLSLCREEEDMQDEEA